MFINIKKIFHLTSIKPFNQLSKYVSYIKAVLNHNFKISSIRNNKFLVVISIKLYLGLQLEMMKNPKTIIQ